MKSYLWFAFRRAIQLFLVVFSGISIAFFITHLSPVSPVESALGRVTMRSNFSPEAITQMRETLTALYGVNEPLMSQYYNFWARLFIGDLGPSLIAFPTPAMTLVMRALPWTVGLLVTSTMITWVLGNSLGGLAGYYQDNKFLKAFGVIAIAIQPIPYYIVAFLLLVILGFIWPILPISGGFSMHVQPGLSFEYVGSILRHSILPALSLVLVGFGLAFLGMRALVSNVVTEEYVVYAELAGVKSSKIAFSYVIRNAIIPQITGLAMSLGAVFSGTVITEQVFNYPGLGTLLIDAVNGGDYAVVLAVSSVAIASVATAIFIVDLIHPLLDPRVKVE